MKSKAAFNHRQQHFAQAPQFLWRPVSVCLLLIFAFSFTGCDKAGVQGGVIAKKFSGITEIYPISPTSVEMKWELNSRFVKYKIYRREVAEAIKEETFGSTQISNLTPLKSYDFSVVGVTDRNEEEGLGSFSTVTTFGNFRGISAENVAVKSANRIDVSWVSENERIRFDIFHKTKEDTFNFNVPSAVVNGAQTYAFESLRPGTTYCFFLKAVYQDGTSEPDEKNLTNPPCSNTQTDVTVLPKISLNPVVFGTYPWFLITGAETNMKTEIYQKNTPPKIDILLGQIIGNGSLRSGVGFEQGEFTFYAKVTQYTATGTERSAIIDLEIVSLIGGGRKTTGLIRNLNIGTDPKKSPLYPNLVSQGLGTQGLGTAVAKGDFNCDGLPDLAISGPETTPYLNSNHDSQQGAVIIYYTQKKFNLTTNKYEFAFKTDTAPSVSAYAPNPQLIYYPSGQYFKLGTKLLSANFNNDCTREFYEEQNRNPLATMRGNCDELYSNTYTLTKTAPGSYDKKLYGKIHSCDDLIIGVNPDYKTGTSSSGKDLTGGFFVLYGDPASGLVSGSSTNNYGVNESTCDLYTGNCRATFLTHHNYDGNTSRFGRAFAAGDFNNDGYDDLAVSSDVLYPTPTPSQTYGKVTVLRGSASGLLPYIYNGSDNFPEIDGSPGASKFYTTVASADISPSSSYYFGHAVGAALNSRVCKTLGLTSDPTRPIGSGGASAAPFADAFYDLSKCDDLIIGDPGRKNGRGSIISCVALMADAGNTAKTESQRKRITGWDCAAHYPKDLEDGARYGFSILGVANQNGYATATSNLVDNAIPDLTGALFVGAPYADVPNSAVVASAPSGSKAGKVFGYYVTPASLVTAGDPGIRKILGGNAINTEAEHLITADNEVACDAENNNVNNDRCKNQVIYIASPEANMHFGWNLSSIDDVRDGPLGQFDRTRSLPYLAVSAPDRSTPGPRGTTIRGAGALFVYRTDLSAIINDPTKISPLVKQPDGSEICQPLRCVCKTSITLQKSTNDANSCFSGGINPYGPTMIIPSNSIANQKFAIGGAVGDNFNGFQESDIIAGAPGNNNSFKLTSGTINSPKVERHGNVYQFNSGDGGFDPSITEPSVLGAITPNVSLELNYRYDMATVVGDVDGDGYEEVITKTLIGVPSKVETVLYYGSPNGLIRSPAPSLSPGRQEPALIQSGTDPLLGIKIYRIGDVNGDGFADVMMVGEDSSYIYYGSSVGLVTNSEPSFTPVGKNPLKFAVNAGTDSLYFHMNASLTSTTNTTWGNDNSLDPSIYAFDTNSLGYGDFNGDGYGDIAIGIDDARSSYLNFIGDLPVDYSTTYFATDNRGKVIVIYGSARGIQVPATGAIYVNQTGLKALNPCVGKVGDPNYKCAIQVLSSSGTSKGKRFGYSVVGVPPMNATSKEWGLLVGDPHYGEGTTNQNGVVYFYQGSMLGIEVDKPKITVLSLKTGTATYENQRFGHSVHIVGDINGDRMDDLVVTAPGKYPVSGTYYGSVYVFYGTLKNALPSFAGLPTTNGNPIDPATSIRPMNARLASSNGSDLLIQRIRPPYLDSDPDALFGYGIARIGDFNADGYADVAMNVAKGTYEDTSKIDRSGFVLIYFGSKRGLMSDGNYGNYSSNPKCVGGDGVNGTCETYQLVLPGVKPYENTYINRSSAGDINGDGLPDLLIGGIGRNHPSGLAYSTGVIYVVY